MAPGTQQRRVKNCTIYRPFVYGSTSRLFDPVKNPKPEGTPADHTHSWTVFVKGVADADITYWLRRVQFKLHDSIPNPLRMVDNVAPGQPFELHETGWGEFEVGLKLHYDPASQEKAQWIYHHLRLHPYGETEADKEKMRQQDEIISIAYEEQVFAEPYEPFWEILTGGGSTDDPKSAGAGGGGKGKKAAAAERERALKQQQQSERTALIPLGNRPGLYFSRESEKAELARFEAAMEKVAEMKKTLEADLGVKEEELRALKEETESKSKT